MKKAVVSIACCALIAPLAFAKDSRQKRRDTIATEQGVTVSGTVITTIEDGAAASYQPAKTLVVRNDGSRDTARYVLSGRGHVVNRRGEIIRTAIKPGTHVQVYFASTGGVRTVDHVVVD
jgi:uncharacterized cupin superfamily protein